MPGFTKNVRLKIGKKKCPKDATIDEYLLNKLGKKQEKEIDQHLFECARCFNEVIKKQDLIDGVKIAFKNKSDVLKKAMNKSIKTIVKDRRIKEALKDAVEDCCRKT